LPGAYQQNTAQYRPAPGEVDLIANVAGRGTVVIQLHTRQSPRATTHIAALARSGFYDGQRFFRVLNQPRPYLVQIGDPASRTEPMNSPRLGLGGSGISVRYEATGFSHEEGAVALATANGNRDTGDSQFYILLGNYSKLLDGTDIVFAKVVQGLDVVRRIELGDTLLTLRVVQG
jgi:cyclophilin family peptidyl-prolyl cis-trans isomerase